MFMNELLFFLKSQFTYKFASLTTLRRLTCIHAKLFPTVKRRMCIHVLRHYFSESSGSRLGDP